MVRAVEMERIEMIIRGVAAAENKEEVGGGHYLRLAGQLADRIVYMSISR